MCTLQLRTKNDCLDTIKYFEQSPAWVISDKKIPKIKKVEIYDHQGKRCLKADFNPDRSYRTNTGRLMVAFDNAEINDCQPPIFKSRNPVQYK